VSVYAIFNNEFLNGNLSQSFRSSVVLVSSLAAQLKKLKKTKTGFFRNTFNIVYSDFDLIYRNTFVSNMYYIDIKIDNFIKYIARRVVSRWDGVSRNLA